MKKLFAILLIAASGFTAQGADPTVKFDFQTSEARTLDLSPSTYIRPLIAEVVVDTKRGRISDSWTLSAKDLAARSIVRKSGDIETEATIQNLKAYGLYKSSEKNNCDLIVAATFDIKITNDGATINLVGYPANFTNWATGTRADYDWITLEQGLQTIDAPKSK